MANDLLQQLEEKVLFLLTQMEDLRKEIKQLKHENALLLAEKQTSATKLQGLVSLLDGVEAFDEVL